MSKRASQSNYYTGRAGGRDFDLLRMLNARLATSRASRAATPRRLPRERVAQAESIVAQAERRPARVTPRMSFDRRLDNYTHGLTMPTARQCRRLAKKARLDGPGTARERVHAQMF